MEVVRCICPCAITERSSAEERGLGLSDFRTYFLSWRTSTVVGYVSNENYFVIIGLQASLSNSFFFAIPLSENEFRSLVLFM